MDVLELFPIDFELTPLARARLREAAGGELAVVPLESLSLERRQAFSKALGRALLEECSAIELEDALPGLSAIAVPSLERWDISDRLRSVLARHRVRSAADVACLSLDEIGLWPNVGRAFQRETAAAAVDALSRAVLRVRSEPALDAVRHSLRESGVARKESPGGPNEVSAWLWSRRSRVRVPSLTSKKTLQRRGFLLSRGPRVCAVVPIWYQPFGRGKSARPDWAVVTRTAGCPYGLLDSGGSWDSSGRIREAFEAALERGLAVRPV